MPFRRDFLLSVILAASAMLPAKAQTAVPDFSGTWQHPVFPWFEPPASGPGPITNLSRWTQSPANSDGAEALPPGVPGVSDYDQLVGDYKNPILQPWAAEVVKRFGEMSKAGITYGNASNQCWPFPMPFLFKEANIQMLQQPDRITILYSGDHEFRTVWMNQQHPKKLTPTLHGDSI